MLEGFLFFHTKDRPVRLEPVPEEEEQVPEADLSDCMLAPEDHVLRNLQDRCHRMHKGNVWSAYRRLKWVYDYGKNDGSKINDHFVYSMSKQLSTC